MPKPGDPVHIPLREKDAIAALLKVKPTADMPRPSDGKKPKKPKAKAAGSANP